MPRDVLVGLSRQHRVSDTREPTGSSCQSPRPDAVGASQHPASSMTIFMNLSREIPQPSKRRQTTHHQPVRGGSWITSLALSAVMSCAALSAVVASLPLPTCLWSRSHVMVYGRASSPAVLVCGFMIRVLEVGRPCHKQLPRGYLFFLPRSSKRPLALYVFVHQVRAPADAVVSEVRCSCSVIL